MPRRAARSAPRRRRELAPAAQRGRPPTPQYLDPLNVTRGNPFLEPEYIRAYELGLQRT